MERRNYWTVVIVGKKNNQTTIKQFLRDIEIFYNYPNKRISSVFGFARALKVHYPTIFVS